MKPSFGFKAVNLGMILALLALSGSLPTRSVQAEPEATFAVTKLTDSNGTCTVTNCSLREAIIAANATTGADTINLPAGAYVLSIAGAGEDLAASGDLDIIALVTITGAGRGTTSIDGADLDRVFDLSTTAGTVNISGVTIKNGSSSIRGGCIQALNSTLTLTNTALMNCFAGNEGGGGLFILSTTVTINGGLIKNNTASGTSGSGGGIYGTNTNLTINNSQISNNTAEKSGGGLFLSNNAATSFNMTSSLVSGNSSDVESGGLALISGASASISNSTISGNHTNGWAGGIGTRFPTSLRHVTIVNNIANENADGYGYTGGILFYQEGAVGTIQNSIIANNQDMVNVNYNDCMVYGAASLTSQGYNLLKTPANCTLSGPGDITGQDPKLSPLQNNGGQSWTHALLSGSPAINAGNPAFAPPPAYDQRGTGYPRVQGGRLDMGAFEGLINVAYLPLIRR